MTPTPPTPETFTAHDLFDPFGIRRHGEMKVVLLADHEARIAKLTAEVKTAEERHVQFMVQGGPVVMAADYEKLLAENTRLKAPVSESENFHFEREDVLKALTGTEHLKANVRRHLSTMTSGEQWSLYRAIAKMVIASRATRTPPQEGQ